MFSAEIVAIGEVMGRWDSAIASEQEHTMVQCTLQEIASEFDWKFLDFSRQSFPIRAEWLRDQSEYAPLAAVREPSLFDDGMPPSFIKLTCLVEYPDQYVDEYLKPSEPTTDLYFPRHEVERIIAADLSKDMAGVLVETILAANIARLASLGYSRVFRFANSEIKGVDEGIRGVMGDVTDDLATRGWPTLAELSVQKVARWLYRVPGFNHRDTQTNLGRALAAATHIVGGHSRETTLHLVWALLGLETLYTHGNFGLQQQLTEKTEVFLGERTTHKSAVSKMYDFRSRFLHGDIDFIYPHNAHQQATRYDRFQNQMFESENTAISVLFATLQKMCMEDRYELKFSYRVSDSSED